MKTTTNSSRSDRLLLLAQEIQSHRKAAGLTQNQLARRIGKSTATVSKIESASQPLDVSTLIAIAEALKTSPERLLLQAQLNQRGDPQWRRRIIAVWQKMLSKMEQAPRRAAA